MKMSLESYERNSWIAAEPTSVDEIKGLLAIVARGIADSKVEAISLDLRFAAAFSAALSAATVALRAAGYRTKTQAGHHQKTVECLEFTIGADQKLINRMRVLSKKRNITFYDTAGNISEQDLELAQETAATLLRDVRLWLKEQYPELLK
jgi:hypothetical protein